MENKVILITGAGSGMGEAAANRFAREGAIVVAADLNEYAAKRIAESINRSGQKAIALKCDVSDEAQVKAMIDKIVETFGRLDFAYNNAGIQLSATDTADIDSIDFDRVINVNLKSVWLCMKYELLQMRKQKSGVIVNNSSIAGINGSIGRAPYAAAKHGVVGLTKSVGAEYASQGIRVNAVCPGTINTPMVENMIKTGDLDEALALQATPSHRFADPDEVASVVFFLCSDAASYMNGQALAIDGGQTII